MRRNRFMFSVMALLLLGVPAWGQQQSGDGKSKPLPTKFDLAHHQRRNSHQGSRRHLPVGMAPWRPLKVT